VISAPDDNLPEARFISAVVVAISQTVEQPTEPDPVMMAVMIMVAVTVMTIVIAMTVVVTVAIVIVMIIFHDDRMNRVLKMTRRRARVARAMVPGTGTVD